MLSFFFYFFICNFKAILFMDAKIELFQKALYLGKQFYKSHKKQKTHFLFILYKIYIALVKLIDQQ